MEENLSSEAMGLSSDAERRLPPVKEADVRHKIAQLITDIRSLEGISRTKDKHRDRRSVIEAQSNIRELEAMVQALYWVLGNRSNLP